MAKRNEAIGRVECIAKSCALACDVYRYRERGQSERSVKNRRFAGKLYFICPEHGKFGGDPRDSKTQEYILTKGEIWGAGKSTVDGQQAPASEPSQPKAPSMESKPTLTGCREKPPAKPQPKAPAPAPAPAPAAPEKVPAPKRSGFGGLVNMFQEDE